MCSLGYSSILNACRVVGIQCVYQVLQMWFYGDSFKKRRIKGGTKPLDLVKR